MRLIISLILVFSMLPSGAFGEEFPGNSVFHLKNTWLDTEGRELHLADLKGHTLVLALVYTSCQYSCPLIIEEMNRVRRKVEKSANSKTRYIMVSMDPARDTPKALKAYAEKRKLDLSSWMLLTARTDDPVRELSAALGVNYKKAGNDFVHSNTITVLNGKGEIVFSKASVGQQIEETAQVITKSASELRAK